MDLLFGIYTHDSWAREDIRSGNGFRVELDSYSDRKMDYYVIVKNEKGDGNFSEFYDKRPGEDRLIDRSGDVFKGRREIQFSFRISWMRNGIQDLRYKVKSISGGLVDDAPNSGRYRH